jgi:hypothetical protein
MAGEAIGGVNSFVPFCIRLPRYDGCVHSPATALLPPLLFSSHCSSRSRGRVSYFYTEVVSSMEGIGFSRRHFYTAIFERQRSMSLLFGISFSQSFFPIVTT